MNQKIEKSLEIKDMLESIESMANQRRIGSDTVLAAVEGALAYVLEREERIKIKHPFYKYRVAIDSKTGIYSTFRGFEVLSDKAYSDLLMQIEQEIEGVTSVGYLNLTAASEISAGVAVGDNYEEEVPSKPLGRIAATQAKQYISQKMYEAERAMRAEEFSHRMGEMLTGQVKRITREYLLLEMGENTEACLPREEMIMRENFSIGERVRVILYEIDTERRGPQLLVSRRHPNLVIELFKIEVPEIGEEVIEIMAAVREPGSRAKIAVKTNDGRMDPVGACVGMRGARVQAVSNELAGERIDIIEWEDNPAQMVLKALAPAEALSIVMDEDSHSMDVIVDEGQQALAIGRAGQNIRLASELVAWKLNVLTQGEYEARLQQEQTDLQQLFMQELEITADLAELLVIEEFASIEELAEVEQEELLSLEGVDEEMASKLQAAATNAMLRSQLTATSGPDLSLESLAGMTSEYLAVLQAADISDRDALAELAVDELQEIIEIDADLAAKLIMDARSHWFE